jgi:DNA-binding GntR family transcriptional regulator
MPKSYLGELKKPDLRTAHSTVKGLIRDAILSGKLGAGTRLVQTELAESLAVSITPIREALRELASEGLVDFDAYRGAVVHEPTTEELENIYEIRSQLLPLSVRKGVLRITEAELAEARQLAAQMETSAGQREWVDLNRRFHQVFDGASRNPHLTAILGRLGDLSDLYVNLSVVARTERRLSAGDEHRQLCDAFARGDTERAVEITVRHLRATVETAKAAFQRSDQGAEGPAGIDDFNGNRDRDVS